MIAKQSYTFDGTTYHRGRELPPEIAAKVQGEEEEEGGDSLEDKTVDDLRDIAEQEGVEAPSTLNKGPLIEAIKEKRA